MIGLGILLTRMGIPCLYRTTAETPGVLIWNREVLGAIRSIRWSEMENIPSNTENPFCRAMRTNLIGFSERVTVLESERLISVTLI